MIPHKLITELNEAHITSEAIEKIMGVVRLVHVKNQTKIFEPHKVCDKAYYILKGGFVCRYMDADLEIERTINFYLDDFHPFMSCVDSFFSGTPTQCELRAICDSSVIEIHKKDLDALIHEDIKLFTFYHTLVTTALQEENDFKLKIISYSSERLYHYLITHCTSIIQKVPARFIAEFMGISPEWLSKLKHRI